MMRTWYWKGTDQANFGYEIEEKKAGYTATLVACRWAGAVMEKFTGAFGQEP